MYSPRKWPIFDYVRLWAISSSLKSSEWYLFSLFVLVDNGTGPQQLKYHFYRFKDGIPSIYTRLKVPKAIHHTVQIPEPGSVDGTHLWVAWSTCLLTKKKRVGLSIFEMQAWCASTDGQEVVALDLKKETYQWRRGMALMAWWPSVPSPVGGYFRT